MESFPDDLLLCVFILEDELGNKRLLNTEVTVNNVMFAHLIASSEPAHYY